MRALPGPCRGRASSGRGFGGLASGAAWLPQPRLWVLPALAVPVVLAGAWLVDRLSAVWCGLFGGTPTTCLASLVHLLVMLAVTVCGLVLATVVALAGHRRGWWVWLAWRAAYGLAWLLSRPVQAWRRHRARPRPVSAVGPATAHVTVEDLPRAGRLRSRPEVDVEWLVDGVWMPAEEGQRTR